MTTAAVAGVQQPAAQGPRVVEVEKLKDTLFVLKGGGGNTAVFIGSKGVVVVDTKNPGWGQPILDKIKELTPKPITTIINTHTHGDHVSGNVEFPATVDVVAHENAAASMKRMKGASGNIFENNQGRGLPKRTYTDKLTLMSGADQVDLYYFGRGHTDGDTWVVFPSLRVVHAGDIFAGKNLPLLDTNNGGTGVEIGDTLGKAHSGIRNVDTIITGHSGQMTMADLKEYSDFNKEFLAFVQSGKKAGQTAAQIVAAYKIPAKYAGYAEPQAQRLQANVESIYNAIK
jgi:glyoxylase-like metal-dependent hydrolase (beta-lactamase superfamily II)